MQLFDGISAFCALPVTVRCLLAFVCSLGIDKVRTQAYFGMKRGEKAQSSHVISKKWQKGSFIRKQRIFRPDLRAKLRSRDADISVSVPSYWNR